MERFWSKVDSSAGPDGCWPWTGCMLGKGYGQFRMDGRATGAHRAALKISGATVPDDKMVLHSCDNRGCVNPSHLRVGTAADNTADMMARGRSGFRPTYGERGGRARLTAEDVREMRVWRRSGYLLREIAAAYDISVSAAHGALTGRTWAHV